MPKVLQNQKKQPSAKLISMRKDIVASMVDYGNSENLLCDAVRSNKMDIIKRIIDVRPSYLNKVDEDGFYPLNWCVDDDHYEMFKYLHTRGANINVKRNDVDVTLLHQAISGQHSKIVEYILCQCDPSLLDVYDSILHHNALSRANMFITNEHNWKHWIHTTIQNYMNLDKIDYDPDVLDWIDNISKQSVDMDDMKDVRNVFSALFGNELDIFFPEEYVKLTQIQLKEIQSYLKNQLKTLISEEESEEEFEESTYEEFDISKLFD